LKLALNRIAECLNNMHLLVVITGASRGFGRAIAVALASISSELQCELSLILWATDLEALRETAALIEARYSRARISLRAVDLADTASLPEHWRLTVESFCAPGIATHAFLIQNAGTLGALQRVADWDSLEWLPRVIAINVTAPMILASLFLRWVHRGNAVAGGVAAASSCVIVNVSSLAAIVPFRCWSSYCAGKAARDMLHRCIAEEEGSAGVKTLSYAPGPLDTDMQVSFVPGPRNMNNESAACGPFSDTISHPPLYACSVKFATAPPWTQTCENSMHA
jgi:sepiapterin reductase